MTSRDFASCCPGSPSNSPTRPAATSPPAPPGEAAAAPAVEPKTPATEPKPGPDVLVPTSEDAKRAGLYLHPEDYRALGLAKLDDGADYNARIRAMIAVWRHDSRYRARVDRLARTAPRGPYSGQHTKKHT